jgi:hypothetical protein
VRLALVLVLGLAACAKAKPAAPEPPPDEHAVEKRSAVVEMLPRGPVLLHIDARRAGVVVPAKHRSDGDLVLRIGYVLLPNIFHGDRGLKLRTA